MKISLVMTTYNGTEYLKEQLLSIVNQTRQPDEVLICDDCSTDNTAELVSDFIQKNGLSHWKLIVNEQNKGWEKNFIDGLSAASGDILFTSDQDDIWHKDKIRIMASVFEEHPDAQVVMCNYKRFWADTPIETDTPVTGKYRKKDSTPQNSTVDHPGCSYSYRKEFFEKMKQNWTTGFANDALIFYSGWIYDVVYLCEDELHFFRRHDKSVTTNAPPMMKREVRYEWLDINRRVVRSLLEQAEGQPVCKYADKLLKWYNLRCDLVGNKKLGNAIRLLGYLPYYISFRTWGTDVYVALKG